MKYLLTLALRAYIPERISEFEVRLQTRVSGQTLTGELLV